MHKIFELKEMDEEKLRGIADELGIKGAKKKDKETLIYDIMDKEAVIDSQKAPEKVAKKRGRPRKNVQAAEQPVQQQDTQKTEPAHSRASRRRKRLRKNGDANRNPPSSRKLQQRKRFRKNRTRTSSRKPKRQNANTEPGNRNSRTSSRSLKPGLRSR